MGRLRCAQMTMMESPVIVTLAVVLFTFGEFVAGQTTLGEFAADAELFKKHRECMEFCNLEHASCEAGKCMCEQPYCGPTCGKQCQHGGECSVTGDNNRCMCPPGWAGESCQIPQPGAV